MAALEIFCGPKNLWVIMQNMHNELKAKGVKHGGFYMLAAPVYMPLDPEYIKLILIKDFTSFPNRNIYHNERDDPISASLLTMDLERWKPLRVKLTPTFTSGKMKMMLKIFLDCGEQLKVLMDDLILKKEPLEIKDILDRFTTDIIGSSAFGMDCNTLKDPSSEFKVYGSKIFNFTRMQSLKGLVTRMFPDLSRFLRVAAIPRDISSFFIGVIQNNIEYREKNNVVRKDFLHLLLETRNTGENKQETLTVNEIAAQSFLFFAAGFETSSATMTFNLFELAINPDIQNKLRQEINDVLLKYNNEVTYEAIMDMQYLDNVVNETLRKHPPFPLIGRVCAKDYTIPKTNVEIKKGTSVIISTLGLHYDPEYYPDPYKFDPERFSEENKSKRPNCTFLAFGDGPRNCIGLRFGLLQTKVGLITLLKNYKFSLSSKMKLPVQMVKTGFIHKIEGGVWLDIERI